MQVINQYQWSKKKIISKPRQFNDIFWVHRWLCVCCANSMVFSAEDSLPHATENQNRTKKYKTFSSCVAFYTQLRRISGSDDITILLLSVRASHILTFDTLSIVIICKWMEWVKCDEIYSEWNKQHRIEIE